jgi:hypothetical protein
VLIALQSCRELGTHFRGEASIPVAAEARTKEEYAVHRHIPAGALTTDIGQLPRTATMNVEEGSWLCKNAVPRKTHRIDFHLIAFDVDAILKRGLF